MAHPTLPPTAILILISTLLLFSPLISVAEPVRDTSGRALRPGVDYYILPVFRGMGGGLTLAARNSTSCPLYVAQDRFEVNSGLPLKIRPFDQRAKSVQLSTDANYVFSAATICVQSTAWTLRSEGDKVYVASGGVVGSPGPATLSNWFKVERSGSRDYKLVFCPTVCKFCKPRCGDLGVFVEGGRRWMGLGGSPFPVMFKRA